MHNAEPADLHQHLTRLLDRAHCPQSGFAVAAVLRCTLGNRTCWFDGVNVENAEQRLSTHAEEGALLAAHTALGPDFYVEEVWVLAHPRGDQTKPHWPDQRPVACCGKCRQQITAFARENTRINAFANDGRSAVTTVSEFLPAPFLLPRTPQPASAAPATLMQNPFDPAQATSWLQQAARPGLISRQARAMVLELADGSAVAGSALEDPAFLSASPAQAALAIAAALGRPLAIKNIWHTDTPSAAELQVLQPFMQP